MTRSDRSVGVLIGVIPIALIIGVWQAIAASGLAPPSLLPPPAAVFARLVQQLGSPAYLDHVATTLFRLFTGFAIAVVIGVTIGLAATGSRAVEAVVRPLVRVLAPVPKIALYPAFILTLGFENASKIALVVADAAFPILLATHQGTSAVEPKLAWSARAAGTSPLLCLVTVVLPAALPSVLTGCRIAPRYLLHRGVPGGDDHLDRRPRPSSGARLAQLSDHRHVRAADHDLAPRPPAQRRLQRLARAAADRISGGAVKSLTPGR